MNSGIDEWTISTMSDPETWDDKEFLSLQADCAIDLSFLESQSVCMAVNYSWESTLQLCSCAEW